MTREELLNSPQYLGISDVEKMFDCGTNRAIKIMREIKSKSDTLGVKGKCTMTDYEKWYKGEKND